MIKRARIEKNYLRVPLRIFDMLLEIYEGASFTDLFSQKKSNKVEDAQ